MPCGAMALALKYEWIQNYNVSNYASVDDATVWMMGVMLESPRSDE